MEESVSGISLNLGCGDVRWPGWLNIDLDQGDQCADLRALPFADGSVSAVAAIHVIEHFHAWEAVDLLREWHRVLAPGGRLIIELPCMDKVLAHIYQSMQNGVQMSAALTWFVFWGDPKYKNPLMVHKWGYTKAMIDEAVREAGFGDIQQCEPRYHFPFRDMRVEATKC